MSALGMGGPPAPAGLPSPITIGGPGPSDATKSDGDWEADLQNALAALRDLAGDATDHVETPH